MEYLFNGIIAICALTLFLTEKLSVKINVQFLICVIIAIKLGMKIGMVVGISLIILEILFWVTLWHGKKKINQNSKAKFTAKVYSRKGLAILTMIIGCALVLIVSKTQVLHKSLITTAVNDNSMIILFVLLMLMFFSDQIGENK